MSNFNLNNIVRENVSTLTPYSSARDEFKTVGTQMIFLDANENPYGYGLNRYPDPQQIDLKTKLAQIKNTNTENILLGNGSDEVLDLIFRAFCEPNRDNVISLPPTYGMYKVLAEINNVANKEVLLNHDFEPDVTAILNQVNRNTKVIFLCSPNNPTGNSFDDQKIEKLLNNFDGLIVIDEAYIDFSEKESWIRKLEQFPNLIITQTFSKAYGMAAIRLGILYGSPGIIEILNRIKPPYNVNQLTQTEALKRLDDIDSVLEQVSVIKGGRRGLVKALLEVGFIYRIYKSDANFILMEVDDATKRYDQLISKGIVVRNRSNQPLCGNCLRITVGTEEENDKLISALKDIENE